MREEFPGWLRIALAEHLGLGPKEADLHRTGPVFFRLGGLFPEPGEVLGGFLRAAIEAGQRREKIVHRADRGIVAEVENGFLIKLTGFLGLLLLAPIPPEVADGLADPGGAGMLVHEVLHEVPVLVVFLHEFEGFRRSEDAFFVSLHILVWDFFELRNAIFQEAFVHQRVAEKHPGLAVFDFPRVSLEVGVKFIDGGRVFLHLLEAIGPPEDSLSALRALGVFGQILAHDLAAGLKLFLKRVGRRDPVSGGRSAGVIRVSFEKISKNSGGGHIFLGL